MKNRKIKKLEPCVIEIYNVDEALLLDSLLSRVIGSKMFCVKRAKKPKKYVFMFWATEVEKILLEEAWDQVVQSKWDDVESVLLE